MQTERRTNTTDERKGDPLSGAQDLKMKEVVCQLCDRQSKLDTRR